MWRPEGWRSTQLLDEQIKRKDYDRGFEAGADAMLEALKKQGQYGNRFDGSLPHIAQTPEKGWAVFIPDIS